jgi:hypothetical protein
LKHQETPLPLDSWRQDCRVSGANLLLPFQVSVLGSTTPAVSATNLLFNIVAIPGGVYRFIRDGRIVQPLTWVVILANLEPATLMGVESKGMILAAEDGSGVHLLMPDAETVPGSKVR